MQVVRYSGLFDFLEEGLASTVESALSTVTQGTKAAMATVVPDEPEVEIIERSVQPETVIEAPIVELPVVEAEKAGIPQDSNSGDFDLSSFLPLLLFLL